MQFLQTAARDSDFSHVDRFVMRWLRHKVKIKITLGFHDCSHRLETQTRRQCLKKWKSLGKTKKYLTFLQIFVRET